MQCRALFFRLLIRKTLPSFAMFFDTQGNLHCITCQTWFVCFSFSIVSVFLGKYSPKLFFFQTQWQNLMFETLLISQYEEMYFIWQHQNKRQIINLLCFCSEVVAHRSRIVIFLNTSAQQAVIVQAHFNYFWNRRNYHTFSIWMRILFASQSNCSNLGMILVILLIVMHYTIFIFH